MADRIGGVFVVAVTALSAIAFAVWLPQNLDIATAHATSLLIVACPCALALATPLAIAVSLGRAAKRKILIRRGDVLQQLASKGRIWFDKTGTLTEGRPRAELVHGQLDAFRCAAAIEREVCHPIADAIVREATRMGEIPSAETGSVELHTGGVCGICDGHRIDVGNEGMMDRQGVSISAEYQDAMERCLRDQSTPVLVSIDGVVSALLSVSDPLKSDAAATVGRLRDMGWEVGILSGDHPQVVAGVAELLGIPSHQSLGGLSPNRNSSGCQRSGPMPMAKRW